MGTLKKTSKATLLHKLEGPVEPLERVSGDYAMVFSLMEWHMSNSLKSPTKTFGQLSTDLLEKIFTTGSKATRIDVVFDVYRDLLVRWKSQEILCNLANFGAVDFMSYFEIKFSAESKSD